LARNWYKYAADDTDGLRLAVGLADLGDRRNTATSDGERNLIPAKMGRIEV